MNIDIKDRVAVGDNKYTMRTLGDGRVELTPSPDSVQEPGTPLNRAFFQSIAGPLPDVVYKLTQTENMSLEIENANQSLSSLKSDIISGKEVKVLIKKSGTNTYFSADIMPRFDTFAIQYIDINGGNDIKTYGWTYDESFGPKLSYNFDSINFSTYIGELFTYVQTLNDRIAALESKIS